MKRWESISFHVLTIIVSVSGFVFLYMKYFLETDDPFALVNHPLQPAMLKAHLLASPFLILVAGMIFSSHIVTKLGNRKTPPHRMSGLFSLVTFPLMVLSGYLLQVTTHQILSRYLLIVHLASGVTFTGAYLLHQTFNLAWLKRVYSFGREKHLATRSADA